MRDSKNIQNIRDSFQRFGRAAALSAKSLSSVEELIRQTYSYQKNEGKKIQPRKESKKKNKEMSTIKPKDSRRIRISRSNGAGMDALVQEAYEAGYEEGAKTGYNKGYKEAEERTTPSRYYSQDSMDYINGSTNPQDSSTVRYTYTFQVDNNFQTRSIQFSYRIQVSTMERGIIGHTSIPYEVYLDAADNTNRLYGILVDVLYNIMRDQALYIEPISFIDGFIGELLACRVLDRVTRTAQVGTSISMVLRNVRNTLIYRVDNGLVLDSELGDVEIPSFDMVNT